MWFVTWNVSFDLTNDGIPDIFKERFYKPTEVMNYQRKFQGKLLYDLKLPMNICFLLEMSCWWQLFSYSFGNHGHKLLSLLTFSQSELYRGVLLVYNVHGVYMQTQVLYMNFVRVLLYIEELIFRIEIRRTALQANFN